MIDGIEKRVPLLPAAADDDQDLTPSLQELIASETPSHPQEHEAKLPVIPQRPVRRSISEESQVPVIPKRPVRKASMEIPVDEPTIPRRPSQRSRVSVEDDEPPAIPHRPVGRQASIRSTKSQDPEDTPDHPKLSTAKSMESVGSEESTEPTIPPRPILKEPEEEPIIPARPARKSSIKNIPETMDETPNIPPRPTRTASIKSIPEQSPEEEPVIPPRPLRTASIKSIPETPEMAPDDEHEAEPILPPRPLRPASIKSIPETPEMAPDDEHHADPIIPPRPVRPASIKSIPDDEPEPVIPPRPARRTSVKSIPETTEHAPAIPQRPTRKSSVKSFKSQHSIDEPEVEKFPTTTQSPEKVHEMSEVPETTGDKIQSIEQEELAPPIEEIPTSPHQHAIENEASAKEAIPEIPARPSKKTVEESTPHIPPRPKKHDEPGLRIAGLAAFTSQQPIIPPRPQKPKSHPADPVPKIAMDQTPNLISTEGGGIFESVEEPIYSKQRRIDPETVLDVKEPQPPVQESPLPAAPKEPGAPSSEVQSELAAKLTKAKSPPIPARPQHKLARQFEQTVKEKPAPPPRPTKPVLAGTSKFAGLRAQFAKDLNERLAKPPAPLPTKKEEEEHSMETEPVVAAAVSAAAVGGGAGAVRGAKEAAKVEDVRKGRARGPTRRPPTVKPIIPAGWGVSEIATVFEQKAEIAESEMEKLEGKTQTGERIIESDDGVKAGYLEGKVGDGDNGVEHAVVSVETAAGEEPQAEKAAEPRNSEEVPKVKATEAEPEAEAPSDEDAIEKIKDMEEGHSGIHLEPTEESDEPEPPLNGEDVEEY